MKKLVISSIGKDKPGIVSAFTKVLYDLNCNIEDSSMTILSNQFSMILIITTPVGFDVEELKKALNEVENQFGLLTTINSLEIVNGQNNKCEECKPYMICVSGGDKTGIAYHITEVLASYNVNITDFNSKLVSKTVNPVYVMMIETQIQPELEFSELEAALKAKAKEIGVDLNINEIEYCEL